jgi:anti-anti-sigma factor
MVSSFFFSAEQQDDILVVSLLRNVGSFAEDEARGEWNDLLQRVSQSDIQHVIVDFRSLSYFGSTLLEWLVALWKRLRTKNGTMAICNLSDVGLEILHTAKFDSLWPVYATRQEAINALGR